MLFPKVYPADSLAKGCIRDFGSVATPGKVIGGIGRETGLSRLVAINSIREYSLERVTVMRISIHLRCEIRTL